MTNQHEFVFEILNCFLFVLVLFKVLKFFWWPWPRRMPCRATGYKYKPRRSLRIRLVPARRPGRRSRRTQGKDKNFHCIRRAPRKKTRQPHHKSTRDDVARPSREKWLPSKQGPSTNYVTFWGHFYELQCYLLATHIPPFAPTFCFLKRRWRVGMCVRARAGVCVRPHC